MSDKHTERTIKKIAFYAMLLYGDWLYRTDAFNHIKILMYFLFNN
jgi:hypothetical protein